MGDANHGRGNNPEMVVGLDVFWSQLSKNFDKQTQAIAKMNNSNNQPIVVQVTLDGKVIAQSTVNNMKEMSRLGTLDTSWL